MATSYQAVFKVPNAAVFTTVPSGHLVFYQKSTGSTGGSGTVSQVITAVFNGGIVPTLGGSITITTQASGSDTLYFVNYTGLTTDPVNDPLLGDLASISLQDDDANYYSAKFISTEDCVREGLCPDCPPSVNPADAEDCLSCYQQQVDNCAEEIVIYGLNDVTTYTVNITDSQSGKVYTSTKISDVNGEIALDTGDYPAGLFSPYNSPLTLTILQNGSPVTLTYGYVNYSCIDILVQNQTEI